MGAFLRRSRIAALWACLSLITHAFASTSAQAESAYDSQQRRLANRVLARGKQPEAALDIVKMAQLLDRADPALSRRLFAKIAESARVDVQHRIQAGRHLAWDLRRTGDVPGSEAAFRALGYVTRFRVAGPFDNEGKRGFDRVFGPEESRTAAVDPNASYPGRERPVRFRPFPEGEKAGYVSFDAVLRPSENVCGFAETSFELDAAETLSLWLGGGGAIKLYFNGEEVLSDPAYRKPHPDRSVAVVRGRKGPNRILVKACTMDTPWGFYLRVGDARGEARPVAESAEAIVEVAASPATKPASLRPLKSVLSQLEARARSHRPSAAALEALARFLWYTKADDPAENRARQLAAQAATAGPNVERYLLASSLSRERYEKVRLVEAALALSPKDARARLAHARLLSRGPAPERALSHVEAIEGTGLDALAARELEVVLLRRFGLDESALSLIGEVRKAAPSSARWLGREADILATRETKDAFLERMEELLDQRYDSFPARKALLEDAVARREDTRALEHLDAIRALFPMEERRLFYVADMYRALEREDLELAILKTAIDVAPESADAHVRMGRALLRGERDDAAVEAFKRALALRPQDADTRELLEQIQPAPRADEQFAVDQGELLERRAKSSKRPLTILQDLTVNTVFENGLGSRFVQFSAQAHDAEGARHLRTQQVQFDPETQRVDIRLARVYRADGQVLEATDAYEQQLGEPWYRIYYDTRALVVVFPDLEPGDSVELRYRVDDVAPRNLFADYYGDLHMLAGAERRKRVEYVLISPVSRKFYFNDPGIQFEHTTTQQGDTRIDRFVATNVAPIVGESDMPGPTEVVPYLHVSTYKSWADVGRWWWGLVNDQLYADASLKKTVAALKRHHPKTPELVTAIYDWVIANTRYVALEFGIHGYLPYRVPQIVRRGFGDCKDKASLIYTMLRQAGVDARLVLVRTRRNGAIDPFPASLAVFDHAIAYVPELDLFLDGTAEHSGARELPEGDQGVNVLVVGPDSAELRKTPVLPAEANLRTRDMEIRLAPDGSGEVRVDETITGADAASYRNRYEAKGTQRDRLERQLSRSYAGLTLLEHSLSGVNDIERKVNLSYRLKAPVVARGAGKELRTPMTSLANLLTQLAQAPSRRFALEIGSRRAYRETRRIEPPQGFSPIHLPESRTLESRFGKLQIALEKRGKSVLVNTTYELNVDRVEQPDYADFRKFIEQADRLLRERIAFAPESN